MLDLWDIVMWQKISGVFLCTHENKLFFIQNDMYYSSRFLHSISFPYLVSTTYLSKILKREYSKVM